jgi:predicted alpha/beta superfamily hydrolase
MTGPGHSDIPLADVFRVASCINQVHYDIRVQLPTGYPGNTLRDYPVIYLLDAHWHFPLKDNDDFIVVGIACADTGTTPADIDKARLRDLLPYALTDRDFKALPQLQAFAADSRLGQARAFHAVLQQEIKPLVELRYRSSGRDILFGHSLGGLFAAWVMVHMPESYRAYVILSPATLYGNYSILSDMHPETATCFYMAVGERESTEMPGIDLVGDTLELHARITDTLARRRLDYSAGLDIIEKTGHISMVPPATEKALAFLLQIPGLLEPPGRLNPPGL